MKKCGGMTIAIKVEFLRNVSFYIVHGCSPQKKSLKKSFLFSIQNFVCYQQAKNFIDEKLVLKKEKSVVFTQNMFSQRDTQSVKKQNL